MNRAQIKAIDELRNQGEKDLYLVTNYIETNTEGTALWNIYASIEDALRWVELCRYAHFFYKSFKEDSFMNFDIFSSICRNEATHQAVYKFQTGDSHDPLIQTFVLERV